MPFVLAERAVNWENAASRRREGRRVENGQRSSFDARNEGHPDNPLLVMVE